LTPSRPTSALTAGAPWLFWVDLNVVLSGCNKDVSHHGLDFVVFAIFLKDGSNRVGTEAVPDTGALQRGDVKEAEEIVGVPFADIPKVWGRLFTGANTRKLVTKLRSSV